MAAIGREPAWQEKTKPQQLQTTDKPHKLRVFPSICLPLSARAGVSRILACNHFTGNDHHRIDLIHAALTPMISCQKAQKGLELARKSLFISQLLVGGGGFEPPTSAV